VVYDGPSAALTPELLAELYGSSASELFATPPDALFGFQAKNPPHLFPTANF
jgi:hypothetical protein